MKTSAVLSKKMKIKLFISKNILIGLMALIALVITIKNPNFFTVSNGLNILRNISIQGILACGVTTILVSGHIDLSYGSTLGITTVIMAMCCNVFGSTGFASVLAIIIGFLLSLIVGITIGFANAYFVTQWRMPPMIVTLAMQFFIYGISGSLTGGYPIYNLPLWFSWLGKGRIFGINISVLICILMFVLFYFILNKTKFGCTVYAVGGNSEAARLSGINVNFYKYAAFIIVQCTAVVGGAIFASQLMSGSNAYGRGLEMLVMASVIIGGTSLEGGAGNMRGTIIGLCFLGLILNAMTILNMQEYPQYVVRGVLIVFAILLSSTQRKVQIEAITYSSEIEIEEGEEANPA